MKTCPNCSGKIGVIDTRALDKEIMRIRCCRECGWCWEIKETVTRDGMGDWQ